MLTCENIRSEDSESFDQIRLVPITLYSFARNTRGQGRIKPYVGPRHRMKKLSFILQFSSTVAVNPFILKKKI